MEGVFGNGRIVVLMIYEKEQEMKKLFHPNLETLKVTSIFYALSNPVRLQIVIELLKKRELSYQEININLSKSTMSYHFKVLRECGIIYTEFLGVKQLVTLRQKDLEKRFPDLMKCLNQSMK